MSQPLRIAFVVSEMVPYIKTGGLADVAAALPKALARLGHDVTVFLPRYDPIWFPPGEFLGSVHVPTDTIARSAGFYRTRTPDGVNVIFIEHPPFYGRREPYGENNTDYEDNRLRFAFLARAALEYLRSRGLRPDVVHAHDWQAGLVPVYLKAFYWDDPTLHRTPTVFTIHNLAYQGNFAHDTIDVLGLPWHLGGGPAMEYYGGVSYLKGGVLFSEVVTTVSPTYAREIQGPEQGYGFDAIVRQRAGDLVGILNGVDYEEWDPAHDPHIAARYSASDLAGKRACKRDLLRLYGLPEDDDLPVIGVISRLVHQKGFDILTQAWWDVLQRPVRLVVLGTGSADVVEGLRHMQAQAPDRIGLRFTYDNVLAHKVEAGADMFLMPSRYEPCGLTQMYSLRYGTVPIVRSTGGLVDTVEPFDAATDTGTGFRFDAADGTGMIWAIDQALAAWADPEAWQRLQKRGMGQDFSWDRSAQHYVDVYHRALGR
jgi:starch synthase